MSKQITVPGKDDPKIQSGVATANDFLAQASDYVIDSPEMYEIGNESLGAMRKAEKELEELRTSITGPINQALKATNAVFKPMAEAIAQAKQLLGSKMLAYRNEQERIKREAEAKALAEREAELKAAREEQERVRREAEEKMAQAKTEADLEEVAAAIDAADAMVMRAEVAPAVGPAAPELAKGGHAVRRRYIGKVVKPAQYLRWLADRIEESEDWADAIDFKVGRLNNYLNATAGKAPPGVMVEVDEKIAARG